MRLEARNLACGYHGQQIGAVSHASWEPGGIHAIIGSNGAGKSTLVRTLFGLHRPIRGSACIGNQDVHAMTAAERAQRMAYVHSTPPTESGLTTGEVLGLMGGTEEHQRAALERLGCADWWNSRMSELSDGQRQRVMIVRALLQQTPWIALDEPTAFLDARSRTALYVVLDELARAGTGILLATHDLHLLAESQVLHSIHAMGESWRKLPIDAGVKNWESAC